MVFVAAFGNSQASHHAIVVDSTATLRTERYTIVLTKHCSEQDVNEEDCAVTYAATSRSGKALTLDGSMDLVPSKLPGAHELYTFHNGETTYVVQREGTVGTLQVERNRTLILKERGTWKDRYDSTDAPNH